MKAIVFDRLGGPEVLHPLELPRPALRPREVLVRVRATSVNPIDWKIRRGLIPLLPRRIPAIVGFDLAGEVAELGEAVGEFSPGQPVMGLLELWRDGADAELVSVNAAHLVAKPASLGFEQAAALPLAGLTAIDGLLRFGQLVPGQQVLVIGASGGVGSFVVQIARAEGAHVSAVCSSRNVELARKLGAHEVFPYDVAPVPGDLRFDLIFDTVGASSFFASAGQLKLGGRYVSTQPTPMNVAGGVAGVFMAKRSIVLLKPHRSGMPRLLELVASGAVQPLIDSVFPLDELRAAHEASERGRARGKLIVTVPGER